MASQEKRPCVHCGGSFSLRGVVTHEKHCKEKMEAKARDKEVEELLEAMAEAKSRRQAEKSTKRRFPSQQKHQKHDATHRAPPASLYDMGTDSMDIVIPTEPIAGPSRQTPADIPSTEEKMFDDIKTEYHPSSGKKPVISRFGDYSRKRRKVRHVTLDREPWAAFETRANFTFAELALEAALNQDQIERFLRLINELAGMNPQFTLSSYAHLQDLWHRAAASHTTFDKRTFSVDYNGAPKEYTLYSRSWWSWTLDLLGDARLAPHIEWDPAILSKWNGSRWVRFVHEPYTGNAWYRVQSNLKYKDGKIVPLLIYADKTKLSTFGNEKGYPVILRIMNIDSSIRNGNRFGSGRVVGWLPIVDENSGEDGKTSYVDFKRVVWHISFQTMLDEIAGVSRSGQWHECGDSVLRHLFPIILVLSADFEEQCIMACTRGIGSNCPCPICLCPKDELWDVTKQHPLRTAEQTSEIVLNKLLTKAELQEKCKELSLRPISNAFWSVRDSDPHRALSIDRLHTLHLGIFGHHLWGEFKRIMTKEMRPEDRAKVDTQIQLLPRWRHMKHFSKVINIDFSDGQTFQDLGKSILFAAHNVLTLAKTKAGYILLRCIRCYLEIDMYLGLELQTEDTIAAGRALLQTWATLIQAYSKEVEKGRDRNTNRQRGKEPKVKSWNFPKAHLLQHGFDDIWNKGATKYYNTKPSESLHGPLKDAYHKSNFRNVADQILRFEERSTIATDIRDLIDYWDKASKKKLLRKKKATAEAQVLHDTDSHQAEQGGSTTRRQNDDDGGYTACSDDSSDDDDDDTEDAPSASKEARTFGHIYISSETKAATLSTVEGYHRDIWQQKAQPTVIDPAFSHFTTRLQSFLATHLPVDDLPDGEPILLDIFDKVIEWNYTNVCYESSVNWYEEADYLRHNPQYHGHPRYDGAIVNMGVDADGRQQFMIARLLFVFTLANGKTTYPIALILPLNGSTGQLTVKDDDLRFYRVRAKPRDKTEFVFLQTIVRGVALIEDFDHYGDYLLWDVVDDDMFLRAKMMYPDKFSAA